jgi:3'5'-cyclic nucleotide phosphodiesterase
MQPWIVYEKWSSRDFEEKYVAFKKGRVSNDPSLTWLETELEFFDNWCIPLAMQLKDCDAFVVNSDEYLTLALKNRQQLAIRGKTMIPELVERLNAGSSTNTGIPVELQAEPTTDMTPTSPEDTKAAKHAERLVKWNVEMLKQLLKQVVAKRQALGLPNVKGVTLPVSKGDIYDEVVEAIEVPSFDPSVSPDKLDAGSIDLGSAVEDQLHMYVVEIGSKFSKNDFHGVDHESQVCMSIKKMLTRITTVLGGEQAGSAFADLDARTFGVSSDPLIQFALVFAGLIHHVDHPGIPSSQLILEEHPLAERYKNRCILEQHSIAVAWELLMQPQYEDLRAAIFSDESEIKRFRQILVNCILGTNFSDEELLMFRKRRWARAFLHGRHENSVEDRNRRATILVELIMQASDIFHATSTWQLYQKWNERQLMQAYKAFKTGRLMQNPTVFWYKSELLLFDEHVIPIAKQISECGVFEQSTRDQYLSFSLSNRQQWAAKGGDHLASMMARYHGAEIESTRTRRAYRRMSLTAPLA